jgi:hypothetical protein
MDMNINRKVTSEQRNNLTGLLKTRFEQNMDRHEGIFWTEVVSRLEANPDRLWSLHEMERTGGEPDVTGRDHLAGEIIFCDCSKESPAGRRSLCYDRQALDARKEYKPENSALDLAAAMGVELLDEEQYRELQKLGPFDTKTSSWLKTPGDIRSLGGALFGDFRYGRTFIYHNGVQSYYAARGFRGLLSI